MDFRNDAVDAGEIGATGHSDTALYAVIFRPNAEGRIATVQLRWEEPDKHRVAEFAPLPASASSSLGICSQLREC